MAVPPCGSAPWPEFGADAHNTGRPATQRPRAERRKKWRRDPVRHGAAPGWRGDRLEGSRSSYDLEGSIRSGINGTPCFFGNGERYDITGGVDTLNDVVKPLLARA